VPLGRTFVTLISPEPQGNRECLAGRNYVMSVWVANLLVGRKATWLVPLLLCAVLVAQAPHAVQLPIGEHNDSREILLESIPRILHGHYQRSRALGNPLYEFVAAAFVWLGGTTLANLYSLTLAIGSVFLFDHLLGHDDNLSSTRRLFVLAAFALNPIFVTNSTSLIEWMQAVLLTLCLIAAAMNYLESRSVASLLGYGLASAGCVLTRPDLIWFCAPVFVAVLWQTQWDARAVAQLAGANALAAAATAAVFLSLNNVSELIAAQDLSDQSILHDVLQAAGSFVAVFGIVGTIAVLVILNHILLRLGRGGLRHTSFPLKLLLLMTPVFAVRFVILPSKIEYLLPWLVILLLAVAIERRATTATAIISASLVLGSIVQVSLLERDGAADALHFRMRLNSGAVVQDWQRRRQNASLLDPQYLLGVAEAAYPGEDHPIQFLRSPKFFPGLISSTNDLVIGEPELYRVDNPRFVASYRPDSSVFFGKADIRRTAYRHIIVCDKSLALAGEGWRVLEPPPPIAVLDPLTGRVDVTCSREQANRE
jgi:hypothetical protein